MFAEKKEPVNFEFTQHVLFSTFVFENLSWRFRDVTKDLIHTVFKVFAVTEWAALNQTI